MEILGINYDATLMLPLLGVVIATILSILKIFEYWNNRFQVEINTILRSAVNLGHDISIKNLSSKPILLEYMEIFTKKGKWLFGEEKCIWSPEDSLLNTRIEPADAKVYNFSQANYFSWKTNPIYVRLHFAGRKPITKRI